MPTSSFAGARYCFSPIFSPRGRSPPDLHQIPHCHFQIRNNPASARTSSPRASTSAAVKSLLSANAKFILMISSSPTAPEKSIPCALLSPLHVSTTGVTDTKVFSPHSRSTIFRPRLSIQNFLKPVYLLFPVEFPASRLNIVNKSVPLTTPQTLYFNPLQPSFQLPYLLLIYILNIPQKPRQPHRHRRNIGYHQKHHKDSGKIKQ